jgi:hypothetical protein
MHYQVSLTQNKIFERWELHACLLIEANVEFEIRKKWRLWRMEKVNEMVVVFW